MPASPQLLPPETATPEPTGISGERNPNIGKRFRRLLRLLGLGFLLWLTILFLSTDGPHPGLSMPFESNLQGLRFSVRSQMNRWMLQDARKRLVLLEIDDSTFEDRALAASWEDTLRRDRHARVIDELSKAGAKCIVFDLFFEFPKPEDKILAASARAARKRGCQIIWAALWKETQEQDLISGRLTMPTPQLRSASPLVGHTYVPLKPGTLAVEEVRPFLKYNGTLEPSMGLAAFQIIAGNEARRISEAAPLEPNGNLTINYLVPAAGEDTFAKIRYEDVYKGVKESGILPNPNFFKDKVVIIGDIRPLEHDYIRTPVGQIPGMEVHAHILSMYLNRAWIHYGSLSAITAILLGAVVLMLTVGALVRSWVALVAGFLVLAAYTAFNFKTFCDTGLLLPFVAPVAAGSLALVGAVAERSWFQDQAKARLDTVVNQYVSDQVSAEGAPRGRVTLVFSDIEDSSELSSQLGEKFEVARTHYFHLLREAAKKHHGFEVETAGDSLFLIFQHAADALDFAIASQQAIRTHKWPSISKFRIRIGVHTGEPYIRRDRNRLTYRGPDTNKAARVTSYASGDEILLTQETLAAASIARPSAFEFEDRQEVTLKGVGTTHLYSLKIP